MANTPATGIFFDVETNTSDQRHLTADEKKVMDDRASQFEIQKQEAVAKANARASAFAKLADLGLTAEEIAAL